MTAQIVDSGNTYDLNLGPAQDFLGRRFVVSSDGTSGTQIVEVQQPISTAAVLSSGQVVSDVTVVAAGLWSCNPAGRRAARSWTAAGRSS